MQVQKYGKDQVVTSKAWVLETVEDSDNTGMVGKKSHSRSINREEKETLSSVSTDRIVKIIERKMALIQLRPEKGRTVNASLICSDIADGQDHFQVVIVNAVKRRCDLFPSVRDKDIGVKEAAGI